MTYIYYSWTGQNPGCTDFSVFMDVSLWKCLNDFLHYSNNGNVKST